MYYKINIYIYIYIYIIYRYIYNIVLKVPEVSIESLEGSYISRWSLEVFNTKFIFVFSKSRPWNLKHESLKYLNGT